MCLFCSFLLQEMFKSIPDERHTTHDVLESIPNLGMIVNLTNTLTDKKYYNPRDWPATVNYLWLKTQGHLTPERHLLLQFCREINKFVKNDPGEFLFIIMIDVLQNPKKGFNHPHTIKNSSCVSVTINRDIVWL